MAVDPLRPINTTPDPASPRLHSRRAPSPVAGRVDVIVALTLSAWGFAMVGTAIVKSLH